MNLLKIFFILLAVFSGDSLAAETNVHSAKAKVLQTFEAANARQGVTVDDHFFYVISNHDLSKYDKKSGTLVSQWNGIEAKPFIHFNAGIIKNNQLIIAHSNHPGVPMTSSIEFFDKVNLLPMDSHSLGVQFGSLTWVDFFKGDLFACFANYSRKGGTPNRGHEYTLLTRLNKSYQVIESWVFPKSVLDKFAPYSSSGGAWGPDGLLYVSGHDLPELYVLSIPEHGSTLEHLATIDVPFNGQAWSWDNSRPSERIIYAINRPTREVLVCEIPEVKLFPATN